MEKSERQKYGEYLEMFVQEVKRMIILVDKQKEKVIKENEKERN